MQNLQSFCRQSDLPWEIAVENLKLPWQEFGSNMKRVHYISLEINPEFHQSSTVKWPRESDGKYLLLLSHSRGDNKCLRLVALTFLQAGSVTRGETAGGENIENGPEKTLFRRKVEFERFWWGVWRYLSYKARLVINSLHFKGKSMEKEKKAAKEISNK